MPEPSCPLYYRGSNHTALPAPRRKKVARNHGESILNRLEWEKVAQRKIFCGNIIPNCRNGTDEMRARFFDPAEQRAKLVRLVGPLPPQQNALSYREFPLLTKHLPHVRQDRAQQQRTTRAAAVRRDLRRGSAMHRLEAMGLMPGQAAQVQHKQQFPQASRLVTRCRDRRGDRRTFPRSGPGPGQVHLGAIFARRCDPRPSGSSLGYGNFSISDILCGLRAAAGQGQRRACNFPLTK